MDEMTQGDPDFWEPRRQLSISPSEARFLRAERLGLGPLGERGTRDRKATRLGFNSRPAGEPTPNPGSPSFGFSDVPWQERTGMFVSSVFPLFSCFLEGRNMKRLAQRFALDSDSFSRDRVREKKFFFACFDFVLKGRDYPARF